MKPKPALRLLSPLVAIVVLAILYWLSQPERLSDASAGKLAGRFSFQRSPLPVLSEEQPKQIRQVHPSLQHLAAWISIVGAAVSLGDLDGDGLPNDVVYVDPRFDQMIVCPAPCTARRYQPFVLNDAAVDWNAATVAPMGSLLGDYNEDGRLDILTYFWGRSPLILLQNDRSSDQKRDSCLVASDFTAHELIEPAEIWHTSAASAADLDGDGHLDLIIGNYNPDKARTLDAQGGGQEVMMGSWARALNGGRNRLFLWSGASPGSSPFVDASEALDHDVACGWTFAIGAADLDSDLLPEIYFVQDFGPDRLLHNRSQPGELKFTLLHGRRGLGTPRSKVLGQDTFNGMGIDFGDLNGDGLLDMLVSNITSDYGMHQSNFAFIHSGEFQQMQAGVAPFSDQSERLGLSRGGWTWETKLADFDNDGVVEAIQATGFIKGEVDRWPELHEMALANEELAKFPPVYPKLGVEDEIAGHEHNPFFVRAEHGKYFDVAPNIQITERGPTADTNSMDEPMLSRGIATADVDGDGRLDFALANQWEASYFYHNTSDRGDFLGLHLRLPRDGDAAETTQVVPGHPQRSRPSIAAIGAQVVVVLADGRKLVGQVDGGNGHSGQRSPDLHFGLGPPDPTRTIETHIRWRDREGVIQRASFADLRSGWYTIYLGKSSKMNAM